MQENYFQSGKGCIIAKAMLPALVSAALLFSGCGKSDGKNSKTVVLAEPRDEVSKKIESLTGDHSRLVWSRYLGKNADVFVNFNQQQLCGIDSRDGRGVRVIIEEKSNYARPLISPDGKWIVYTNKHTDKQGNKKTFKPVIHRVDWNGEQGKELGKGLAVDIWKDPVTKTVWVYVANLIPTVHASLFANRLERFQFDDPKKREVVWKKTEISIDSIQLSSDGKRACCLFPWPDAGVLDLAKKEYWKNQHGCWPSLAPDNSYVAWVFDGSHKSVHLFADRGKKLAVVPINNGPGMDGHEVYHPRWSNDARFITVTGPYKGRSIGKSGKSADVYIGEFSKTLESIKNWVQVTDDNKGDHFPDLWVKGGEKVSLGKIGGAEDSRADPKAGLAKSWPSNPEGLLYLWENAGVQTPNKLGSGNSQRTCKVEAHQRARFGRHFEMLTGGGFFEVDAASVSAIDRQIGKGDFAFQLLLTSNVRKQSGTILAHEGFQLRQEESGELVLSGPEGENVLLGSIEAGSPLHLAVSYLGGKWSLYRDGAALETDVTGKSDSENPVFSGLVIGDGKWDGKVEELAVYGRGLTAEEVAGEAAFLAAMLKKRKPVQRIKLRGKLVGMTDVRGVEELDTYRRALLVYTYEVEKVIEGKYDRSKVIVNHWSIMDREPLRSIPGKLGQSYTLEIELFKEHPELEGERRWNDSMEIADEYFDVTTPEP